MISRYLAIAYWHECNGKGALLGPALATINDSEPNEYCLVEERKKLTLSKHAVLSLRAYESSKPGDEYVKLRFLKDFPPISHSASQSAGWLAPDGKWFPCSTFEHDDLAEKLSAVYYNNIYGGVDILERRGWIRISSHGDLRFDPRIPPTQEQIDTMFEIQRASRGAYHRYISEGLRCVMDWQLEEIRDES